MTELLVEVRTWPECTGTMVIDCQRALVLAQYQLPTEEAESDDPLFDLFSSYQARSERALTNLERDQEYLQMHCGVDTSVALQLDTSGRERIQEMLNARALTLAQLDFDQLRECAELLEQMPLQQLFKLLVDWHDVIERHYPQGSSYLDPRSWVHRSAPADCYQFHYLANGSESLKDVQSEDADRAYQLFEELINVPFTEFNWGLFLRWVYFHRAEFPQVRSEDRFSLRALSHTNR